MSDFLSNLVGRSLGSVEMVRPRVPSKFEPHRQGSGLIAPRPSVPDRDADPAPIASQQAETATTPRDHQTPTPRTRTLRQVARGRQFPEADPNAQPDEATDFEHPTTPAPPLVAPGAALHPEPTQARHIPDRRQAETEPDSPGTPRPATRDPIQAAPNERLEWPSLVPFRPPSRPAEGPEATSPEANRQPASFQPNPRTETQAEANAEGKAEAKAETKPGTRSELQAANPDRRPDPSREARAMPLPSLVPQQLPANASGIRPPIAPKPEGARSQARAAEANAAHQSNPTIEVSIGRVEVRAVFPEQQPARRPAQPRQRPTVSLDDYLNQRQRGKR